MSAEWGPWGRTVSKVLTGASGTLSKVDEVMPLRIAVCPSRIRVIAFALQYELEVGECCAAVGDEIGGAGQRASQDRRVHRRGADE